jgi:hypothetical protein
MHYWKTQLIGALSDKSLLQNFQRLNKAPLLGGR